MKRITLSVLAAGAAFVAFSAPAQAAVTVDTANCSNLTVVGNRCLFNGVNLANTAEAAAVQNAYNVQYNPDIDLSGLLLGTNPGTNFGSMTGAGTQSGSWSTPGYLIQYLAVSGGNKTFLYYLGGVSSGDWSTLGIVNNGGQQPNLSHLAFFGTQAPVPEPATWAMLIAGMGIVGASMRRRKTAVSFA